MLMKEYRICMPLTVDEYRIGQLYMISKHSCEQSGGGEGVEVVRNEPDNHPKYGAGQLTEKRIYLSSKLPSWVKAFVPRFFYITEKAWNFYPYTITEYSVSFLPKFSIRIETRFENNNGDNDNVFGDKPTPAENVCFLDILSDPIPEKHYKESEDLSLWQSSKTGRGPLEKGWRDSHKPVMCSYKRVECSFEVYGFQTRTEEFIHRVRSDSFPLCSFHCYCNVTASRRHHNLLQYSGLVPRPAFSRSISVTDERSLKKMGVTTAAVPDPSHVTHSPIRLNSTPE
ncbi:cytoplasmic phosphatidylinositol transfer protein 1b [Neolamprologus brichardi]|uniref:cytoplasmic phosphatidylinositol transfer protein 1b n=1 Tax=Neolamprologus brichardi TaxID=32507 RepID=UPI0003EBECAF|nr:cytoplasmic phosphatidylinositol transfer protein 1b [Neolamprologus brichardi]